MGWHLGLGGLVFGGSALGLFALQTLRRSLSVAREATARRQFRMQREWLEAHFLDVLSRIDPLERLRWEDARWSDSVVWARDRRTKRLLALVGVLFDADPFTDEQELPPRAATALFEYRKARWHAEGKRLDEVHPDEALLRHRRFLPIVVPHPWS